jgi:hypothetical protein
MYYSLMELNLHCVDVLEYRTLPTKFVSLIYRTIILPVVMHRCETWSLTLREEHRLRVFENRVLRGIFEPKRAEVIGGWRKLHNVELHKLYCSPSMIRIIKSRRMRWTEYVARMGATRNAFRTMVGKPEGKRPLQNPTRRWDENIRMDLREIVRGGMDWTDLDLGKNQWRALVNKAMNLRVL